MLVSGGVSSEVQSEVEKAVREFNGTGGAGVKFVETPIGIREKLGPEGHKKWIKDSLTKELSTDN